MRAHPFFVGLDWVAAAQVRLKPPFVPNLSGARDLAHFDEEFSSAKPTLTPPAAESKKLLLTADPAEFSGFSYTNPHF